jgi:hypothetical protein
MAVTNGEGRISPESTTLIGRAFKDEPVKLMAIADWGVALEVRNEGGGGSIGFRKEWLYRFDAQLFSKPSAAYSWRDSKALRALWASAEPYRNYGSDSLCPT